MFQEGKWLTGYVVNNLELLQKNRVDGEITPVRFFNGIVRSGVTAVITNDGEVSAGLNYHIIPKDTMAAGDMSVAHNYGSHKLTLQSAFSEDNVVEINSDTRLVTRNGNRIKADGFILIQQEVSFGTISIDRDGVPDSYSGNAVIGEGYASVLDEEAVLKYTFEVPTAGTYDVAVEIVYPRWDKNSIGISLDGDSHMLSESRLYFLYWRKKFWRILKSGVSLSAGTHIITVSGGVPGVVFYGFQVCSDFSQKATAGEVYYSLKPRKFMDVNGEMVQLDRAFKVTAEVLRRKPESALVWYEDFCDYSEIPTNYFTVLDGSWKIWKDESSECVRKYSQLEGSGKLALDYTEFSEIHVRARFAFKATGGGKAGVFLGSIYYDTQCVELYQGNTKLGSYSSSFSKTSNADLRNNPSLYTVEMRIRGNKVRVYSGAAYTLRFTATITAETGYVGFMAEKGVVCDLLRLGQKENPDGKGWAAGARYGAKIIAILNAMIGIKSEAAELEEVWYRVRKTWADAATQKGAFHSLENAKKCADENEGYSVFDESGKVLYSNDTFIPYLVRVSINDLNIRKGSGTDYDKTGKYTGKGAFTIVEEAEGKGASLWGLLKSYQKNRDGWISLDYVHRI